MRKKVLIMGAAGRDFHNFNIYFRNNENYEVVAFTAAQIPDIDDRRYPPQLSGKLYPEGIPIKPEEDLEMLIKENQIDEVVFAYSDITHEYVMHKASLALALGANFTLLGTKHTSIKSTKPVISICATRTGCGKSQTTRRVEKILKDMGKKVVAIRHPMPYGDLSRQIVQRFATLEDISLNNCTIEEREEYEPHIASGFVIYAGVDYEKILREAEKEADIILWDGGNNDTSFYESNLKIVVVDPHRLGDELVYHPGETNLRNADVFIINKIDTAKKGNVESLKKNLTNANPRAIQIEANSPVSVTNNHLIEGKKVLVIEDGPTLTHGGMKYGAGTVAAEKFGASEIIDPRPYVTGKIAETFQTYPKIGKLLPAMGYGDEQMKDLETVINTSECDLVIIGTPINLGALLKINKPSVRVTYDLEEISSPNLNDILKKFLSERIK